MTPVSTTMLGPIAASVSQALAPDSPTGKAAKSQVRRNFCIDSRLISGQNYAPLSRKGRLETRAGGKKQAKC